jgi:signal transduction histidine kinase
MLVTPLLRGEAAIGFICLRRLEVRPFTEVQIELLKTFADQAVIAIENARLFGELQDRTRELAQSVEELEALGMVSQAVTSTLDLQQVLTTVLTHAVDLSGMDGGSIFEFDEATGEFHDRATVGLGEGVIHGPLRETPLHIGEGMLGRAVEERQPVQVADIQTDGAYVGPNREMLIQAGYRAMLAVPLLHDDQVIGGLTVRRATPGEVPPKTVELLKTFASQSALAIQNARLFAELADKSAQLEVASRHKSEFLATMSHELRSPLNAIIGFSEVLLEKMFGELNDKQEDYLRDVLTSGQHLLSLINDILDLSKLEAGQMELEISTFSLPTVLDSGLTMIRERAGRHGIVLSLDVDASVGELQGDERKVKQALFNLLSNAVKFTPDAGRIDVTARLVCDGVEICVRDTGVGIAPEDQEHVFEEFRQVGAASGKVEGTGLGLALTRKFVELHGGRIRVESELGGGSAFTVALPLVPPKRVTSEDSDLTTV